MINGFHKIDIVAARLFLNRKARTYSQGEFSRFMEGYNMAVDRLNNYCEKECKKVCGYCGTEKIGKQIKCAKCGIDF